MTAPIDTERLLAARAADGDGGAIEQLYDRYEKRLFNYCHRITGNREDAADATQEAFCNVIQRLPGIDVAQLNFGAYLFTAARNACLDIIAQRKRAIATDEVPDEAGAVLPIEFDPERSALNEDQKRAARAANARLPEKQRTVLALREVAELSYEDIAGALEMNANSVAQLISRARLNFFKQLRAAAVVIPPLDEAGERAIELAVARQDGRIEDEELTWLEQHLRENEASRINVEAIHESTAMYRAIGPVAVVMALRDEAVARAAESVPHASRAAQTEPGSNTGAATTTTTAGSAGAADSAGQSDPRPGATDSTSEKRSFRRRATIAASVLLAVVLTIGAVSGLGDDAVQRVEPASEVVPETAAVEERKSNRRSERSDQAERSETEATPANPYGELQADTDSRRDKGSEAGKKQKESQPDDTSTDAPVEEAPPVPPPAEPTGPTTKPPGPKAPPSGPPILCGNNCNGPTVN